MHCTKWSIYFTVFAFFRLKYPYSHAGMRTDTTGSEFFLYPVANKSIELTTSSEKFTSKSQGKMDVCKFIIYLFLKHHYNVKEKF